MLATVNQPILLSLVTGDARTDLFCQAHVLDSTGTIVATLSLPHLNLGVYGVNYTPTIEGYYSVIFNLFLDSGFSTPAGYDTQGEDLDVSSYRTNINRIMGLLHENSVIDMQTYDADQNLTSARLRCYDTAAHAALAGSTGLTFEYSVSASYSSGNLNKYSIARVS